MCFSTNTLTHSLSLSLSLSTFLPNVQAAEKKAAREKLAVEQARIAEEKAAVARKKKAATLARKNEERTRMAAKKPMGGGGKKKLGKVAEKTPSRLQNACCSTMGLIAVAVVCVGGVVYQLV